MARTTTAGLIAKLRKVQKEIISQKKFEPCYRTAHNTLSVRIFVNGKRSSNTNIGKYSVKAGYFSDKDMPRRFSGGNTGKTGEKIFKNGKPHKTKYFKRGYKQVRANQGVGNAKVDLNLTGDLSRDFSNSFRRRGKTYTSSVRRGNNVDKLNGAEDKYGKSGAKIFKHTTKEVKSLSRCLGLKVKQIHD